MSQKKTISRTTSTPTISAAERPTAIKRPKSKKQTPKNWRESMMQRKTNG